MTLSLDVLYHLIEDNVYYNYLNQLFELSDAFVIIYSSDMKDDGRYPSHVRPRKFTDWVKTNIPEFDLIDHIPNKFSSEHDENSTDILAHFFVYKKKETTKR